MAYRRDLWSRIEHNGIPVYVRLDRPAWFVPNQAGDQVLLHLAPGLPNDGNHLVQRFLNRLPDCEPKEYPGRASFLEIEHLRELWFHITNRCNLTCHHCLFASSPGERAELSTETICQLADEAAALGCRVFALTGGEPFIHPGFAAIVDRLLSFDQTHVVVLTNGMSLRKHLRGRPWDFARLHLQVSVDGLRSHHDRIRGRGLFDKLTDTLKWLRSEGIPFTLSMAVDSKNLTDMPGLVDFAADMGAGNVHFMWYFIRGRAEAAGFALPDRIFESLVQSARRSEVRGIPIDNIRALRTQVFAPSGTIHDGSTAGWESAAIGPDGKLYPSAALVGIDALATGLEGGLASAWRESPTLERVRRASVAELSSPLRWILGGGDTDHSFLHGGAFVGHDPYMPLHEKTALWLITREVNPRDEDGPPRLLLKMGDVLESCGAHGSIALVHSNCLLAIAQTDSLTVVKEFYADAADDAKEEILNPVCYPDEWTRHIPEEFRFRGYGCASPVADAEIREGETIVDLGCGTGVECFIAARLAGPGGRVIGIDMLDPMLDRAHQALPAVTQELGYQTLDFRQGYLEELPLEDGSVDVVLSNCVLNLSVHKRRSFAEIFRILRDGGRLVISDVVCETEPDAALRNNEVLRGECIAGALTQKDLIGILEEEGFESIKLIQRFPYRTVAGHPFFSLTYTARKPRVSDRVRVMYRGPLAAAVTLGGTILTPGVVREIPRHEAEMLGEQVFILGDQGAVTNIDAANPCCCSVAPGERTAAADRSVPLGMAVAVRRRSGCMACGERVQYLPEDRESHCYYCGKLMVTDALCDKGHFVCDACHSQDGLKVIEHICLETSETDMMILLQEIREHPAVPIHGPEHHALVPGIILASYRNLGGDLSRSVIRTGIRRGAQVAGGYCAFMGVCGAAVGVGVAFSLILGANPLTATLRKTTQSAVREVLTEIAALKAARCCQRDAWLALRKAAELSKTVLPLPLRAEVPVRCTQQDENAECVGLACPLLKASRSIHAADLHSDIRKLTPAKNGNSAIHIVQR